MGTLCAAALLLAADQYSAERERMVRRDIEGRGVRDAAVVKALLAVPRHLFVPEPLRSQAYADHPLPIGHDATISQPYIVGLMTELLGVSRGQKVLEIGTGSGYQAAILAEMGARVYTIELVPELARTAGETLRRQGYTVEVRSGDGYRGWPEAAPFDRIILTAAPPEVPRALIDQLARGGRLVAPVGGSVLTQELVVIDKLADGKLRRRTEGGVRFVPMRPGK
jgi:protein-L-isoaspartate(D-aspartate) O-methyltransferase